MTFRELINETRYLLRDTNFLTNNEGQYVETYLKNWLNEGERQFCLITDFGVEQAYNITSVSGTAEYALPNDFIREVSVIYNYNNLLKDRYVNSLKISTTGTPYAYYLRMNNIGFIPTPNNTYTIILVYLTQGGNMVNDNDVPIIPTIYQDILIHYACMKASLQGDDVRYKYFREIWGEKIQMAKQHWFYRDNMQADSRVGTGNINPVVGDMDNFITGI